MRIINFILKAILKTIALAFSLSMALIKFTLVTVLIIISLGAFASSTSKY